LKTWAGERLSCRSSRGGGSSRIAAPDSA
jgi:hypothetical protein